MLAEADYVRRRLKILRQKKIQEAEDLLRVFCLYVCVAAITWIDAVVESHVHVTVHTTPFASSSTLIGASYHVGRHCTVLYLPPGPC